MFSASTAKPSIAVFGSINIDLVAQTPRLPVPGETLQGHTFLTVPGGKGANQAVAVAKLGVSTQMVGRVGGDSFGKQLLQSLQIAGVEVDSVLVDEGISSGIAAIAVDDAGENQIIIIPGANGRVDETDVQRLTSLLPGVGTLLLQLEIPIQAVILAAQAAKKAGVTVILDPAPANLDIPEQLYQFVDIITPNEIEAAQLVGFSVNNQESATKAANVLLQKGVKTAIVKLGDRGVVCVTTEATFFVPAFPISAVDTVGAGDAFNGGLAVGLTEKLSLQQAVIIGAAVGALSTTKAGAQTSLPDKDTVNLFLKQQGII